MSYGVVDTDFTSLLCISSCISLSICVLISKSAILVLLILSTKSGSLLFFLRTFLEEYLAKNFLLLLVRIIILYVIVGWLIKREVIIVVAVRILVSDATGLHHVTLSSCLILWIHTYLWCQKQHSFMKTTNNWNFWLNLLLLIWRMLSNALSHLVVGLR
jgi:hypothetical protein